MSFFTKNKIKLKIIEIPQTERSKNKKIKEIIQFCTSEYLEVRGVKYVAS